MAIPLLASSQQDAMQTINTIEELDAKIAECDRAEKQSDHALRRVFDSFRMAVPANLPAEPQGRDYAEFQFELYRRLAGKPYCIENEATRFDVEKAARCPFPYSTQNTLVASDQYTAIGAILRHLKLPPGSRIVEFGPGWGNTTIALAQLGMQVTAVDIEPRFCELIQRRATMHGVTVETVNADFLWIESSHEQFDAALFFECFHHASDHRRLLRGLWSALKPEGRLLLAAEPVSPDFPMPWGLRMDGQSLWSIRKHGWFELGFNESYFVEALTSEGWIALKHPSSETPVADVWVARKLLHQPQLYVASDPAIYVPSGMRDESGIKLHRLSQEWGFFGPYATLPPGNWQARIHLIPGPELIGQVVLDVCTGHGQQIIASREIDLFQLPAYSTAIELDFTLAKVTTLIEARMYCQNPCTVGIQAIEFVPLA
jgi:ubiquinone/menaquinone biosynthesis C-methylase UbiE